MHESRRQLAERQEPSAAPAVRREAKEGVELDCPERVWPLDTAPPRNPPSPWPFVSLAMRRVKIVDRPDEVYSYAAPTYTPARFDFD
jgi:hypothetical protein